MMRFEPILPVVVLDSAEDAEPLGRALVAAGIHQAEITLRTSAALDAIASLTRLPGMVVGAGTVLDAAQVDAAVDAGAAFLVSPGLSQSVLARAEGRGIPVVPGVATASEIIRTRELGIRLVKFFPAESLGGAAAISALTSVFPDVAFVPTGGIDADRAKDYLALPSVMAIGGSWMVPRAAIAAGDFALVERLCREAVLASAVVGSPGGEP
jgi:2-dehydro-3-deoxyphosphogluconate aldolase/(4S)-4-hydroxy-2-oxoglutarate aldolase